MSHRWRLLRETDGDGAWNMAVDEVLLDTYVTDGAGSRAPTLRLYGWSRPTLSLGRHQDAREGCDPAFLRREGIDLTRRPTGGSAVLHDDERTYAVVGHLQEPFSGSVRDAYRQVERALIAALAELGIGAERSEKGALEGGPSGICFAVRGPHELDAEGCKLVGSAQLRRGRAFLQHGSIPIRIDRERLATAAGRPGQSVAATSLSEVLGRRPPTEEIDRALCAGFRQVLGAEWSDEGLTDDERQAAHRLRRRKYLSAAWTLGRES